MAWSWILHRAIKAGGGRKPWRGILCAEQALCPLSPAQTPLAGQPGGDSPSRAGTAQGRGSRTSASPGHGAGACPSPHCCRGVTHPGDGTAAVCEGFFLWLDFPPVSHLWFLCTDVLPSLLHCLAPCGRPSRVLLSHQLCTKSIFNCCLSSFTPGELSPASHSQFPFSGTRFLVQVPSTWSKSKWELFSHLFRASVDAIQGLFSPALPSILAKSSCHCSSSSC